MDKVGAVDTGALQPPSSASSPDSAEFEDDSSHQFSSAWPGQEKDSPTDTPSATSQQPQPSVPLQKRRRVTRACDECRRKKIKCDGKQPCTHCTVYSYDCTYDQPSNRRRNPAPQYIEMMEHRLQRMEVLLKTYVPNIELNEANLDTLIQQRRRDSEISPSILKTERDVESNQESTQEAQLRSMIDTTGDLNLDERGHWDFHGGSSGAVWLKRMREQFGGLLGPHDSKTPFLPRPPRFYDKIPHGSPGSGDSPFESGLPNTADLPPRETARYLCHNSLTYACALIHVVHEPSFYAMFDRIYSIPPEDFGDEENRFLPLLYVVLALGCMFIVNTDDQPGPTYKAGIEQGVKYFQIARSMMDITDCRDITSLMAILFMILFLQSSSNLSTCYSYIGIALRSALRMGLHRNLTGKFDLIERETRRRVFWIIRKMDTYVAALLGFPRALDDDDIDQVLPLEVDDEYITKDAILTMPPGSISLFAASNAHTKLMDILAKVIKYVYPIKGVDNMLHSSTSPTYVVGNAKIKEVERDLQDWLDKLPLALHPGGSTTVEIVRVQQLLRMSYAHVQMMLYRPFLHYVSQKSSANKSLDDRAYACGAAMVSVSRNIVHIAVEMQRQGLLVGAYWFNMYTTFFAVLSLAFYVLENHGKRGAEEVYADANAGRDCLKRLAKNSLAADRCSIALNGLFEQLPAKLSRHRSDTDIKVQKKRSASSLNKPPANSELAIPTLSKGQRATTFPVQIESNVSARPANPSLDIPGYLGPYTSASDQNLRQSYQDLVNPPQMSSVGTPDSSATGSSGLGFQFQAPGSANGVPDLGAMMFPSADPFAYPNQPMFELDARRGEVPNSQRGMDGNGGIANMYLSNGEVRSPFADSLEGQLFGPLPPYLVQPGQQGYDMNQMGGMQMQNEGLSFQGHTGLTPMVMGYEGNIFEASEGWSSMMGQGYRHQ